MHFLRELIRTPILEDPYNNNPQIHRHFHRYSKGDFIGPALKITKTNNRITLKGSHEYEDLILEIVANTIPKNEEVDIQGTLIAVSDIRETIMNLGFDWDLKKSQGQTKNYKASVSSICRKGILIRSVEAFRKHSYFLISFDKNTTCKINTKNKIPQPSKKKVDDDKVNKRVSFCTGVIKNSRVNLQLVCNLALPDVISELPEMWRNIIIKNNYKITNILLPDEIEDWELERKRSTREGIWFRSISIDEELIEKQYTIVV